MRTPLFLQKLAGIIVLQSYLLGLGSAAVLGGAYMFTRSDAPAAAATNTLAQAERRTIVSSVKSTGEVTFANEQELRFNQKGKVANVYFKEGDRVSKGQLIAQLDTSSVSADIRQAQLSLSASALQLQQLQSEKEKTLVDAQNAVKESERQFQEAQDTLAVSQEKLPSDIATAERAVTEKESAVEQAKANLAQAKITTLQSLGSTAQDILAASEEMLDTLYGVLVNDASARRTTSSLPFEIYYRLYNDPALRNETERSYNASAQAVETIRARYGSTLPALRDADALAAALADARTAADSLRVLADTMYRLIQGATDDPTDFTVNDINTVKQSALTARSSATVLVSDAETALASLTGGKDGLTSIAIQQKEDALTSAQHALLTAQANLAILKTQTPGDLQQQQAAVAKIQDEYTSKQLALNATSKNADVSEKLKRNDIAQKSTSLQKTAKTIEDYQLKAPFDGVIRRLDYQVGDNLLDTSEDKYVVLENPDFLIVTVLLDQVDIVRVRKDMKASIVFDALPDQTFEGTIAEINSTPVEESGVVSYEVSIRLPTPKELTILSGMTATVQIETTRKESVLTVPNLALQRTNGTASVTLESGQSVTVKTGATDGQFTEILSGLQEGDSVVSLNVSNAQTGSNQNATQLLRMGAGPAGASLAPGGAAVRGGGQNFQR